MCIYIMFLLGTSALGRPFPSQFPGDHKEVQKGENCHPNSPFSHSGKSMDFVGLTSQFNASDNCGFCMNWRHEFSQATFP